MLMSHVMFAALDSGRKDPFNQSRTRARAKQSGRRTAIFGVRTLIHV